MFSNTRSRNWCRNLHGRVPHRHGLTIPPGKTNSIRQSRCRYQTEFDTLPFIHLVGVEVKAMDVSAYVEETSLAKESNVA